MEKKKKWFVKTWTWANAKKEYVPDLISFYTESEARKVYDSIRINNDIAGASLIDDTANKWETIDWKPL